MRIARLAALAEEVRFGAITSLCLHWTGGTYHPNDTDKRDYHILIDGFGMILPQTDDLTEMREHTFGRNTGSVGIALCCCFGAIPDKDGLPSATKYPPLDVQIEAMAKAVATLAPALGLKININTVLTHAEAADNLDGLKIDYSRLRGGYNGRPLGMYGPQNGCEKWDLHRLKDYDGRIRSGGDIIRGKALWYLEKEEGK